MFGLGRVHVIREEDKVCAKSSSCTLANQHSYWESLSGRSVSAAGPGLFCGSLNVTWSAARWWRVCKECPRSTAGHSERILSIQPGFSALDDQFVFGISAQPIQNFIFSVTYFPVWVKEFSSSSLLSLKLFPHLLCFHCFRGNLNDLACWCLEWDQNSRVTGTNAGFSPHQREKRRQRSFWSSVVWSSCFRGAAPTPNPSCWVQIPDRLHVNTFHYCWTGLGYKTEQTKLGISDTLAWRCTCASPTTTQIMLNKSDFLSHWGCSGKKNQSSPRFLFSSIVCFSLDRRNWKNLQRVTW